MVEDDQDIRAHLALLITRAKGFQLAGQYASAEEALEQIPRCPPDVVLMDINLPEVDGYTITARIKSTPGLEAIKVIALTANVMKGDREKTLAAGCDGYIQKPIDVDIFPTQIAGFLEQAA